MASEKRRRRIAERIVTLENILRRNPAPDKRDAIEQELAEIPERFKLDLEDLLEIDEMVQKKIGK